jgi:hypothetical protein
MQFCIMESHNVLHNAMFHVGSDKRKTDGQGKNLVRKFLLHFLLKLKCFTHLFQSNNTCEWNPLYLYKDDPL